MEVTVTYAREQHDDKGNMVELKFVLTPIKNCKTWIWGAVNSRDCLLALPQRSEGRPLTFV